MARRENKIRESFNGTGEQIVEPVDSIRRVYSIQSEDGETIRKDSREKETNQTNRIEFETRRENIRRSGD